MEARIFLERRSTYQFVAREQGAAELTDRSDALGLGEEAPGTREYRHVSGHREVEAALRRHRTGLRAQGERLLSSADPIATELEQARAFCSGLAAGMNERGTPGVRALLYRSCQDVVAGDPEGARSDRRAMLILELSGALRTPGRSLDCWRALSFSGWDELTASSAQLALTLDEIASVLREGGPGMACPRGSFPAVFPPGAASGSFFHEVCGHPLEGDVVARQASYLARCRGEQIAPEFVTVSDDPSRGEGCAYAIDDEGAPAARVPLIDAGRVAGPLLDRDSAQLLAQPANGHGRRVDFRHPALPRMAHTRLEPHRGTLAEFLDAVGEGLLIQHLTPRHVNLLSGEFSFFINEARWIERGRLTQLIGPSVLRGRGAEALGSIVAVGSDYRPLFATRGCRKLDHGPLHVSFGQPSIRFSELTVEPWY